MKSRSRTFDPDVYASVAERVQLFWGSFPNGRIVTRLVSRTEREVVFEARVYRSVTEDEPAATGWAAEREGDGEVNAIACLENTETSAVGRALANLGFAAAKERQSIEQIPIVAPTPLPLSRGAGLPRPDDAVGDFLDLLGSAERLGLSPTRTRVLRRALEGVSDPATLQRAVRVLRRWVRHRAEAHVQAFGITRSS